MRHRKVIEFEHQLKAVFDRIDHRLEEKYGDRYPLHPSRAEVGETSSPGHDGLFRIGASFSAGFGSQHGRGYIVDVRMITLKRVPRQERHAIEDEVATMLKEELPKAFPGRDLTVERDGPVYKIIGDLSLGSL